MDPVAWGLAVGACAAIIGLNCGVGMLGTMYLQADILANGWCDWGSSCDELVASLQAEWDACTVIIGKQADG